MTALASNAPSSSGAPRVLQVITDDDRRGAQVFATDLHRALVARGVAVRTVALAPGATGGLGVETLGATRKSPSTVRALHAAMADTDVTVAHGSTTLPISALAAAGTDTRLVYRQISDSLFWAGTRGRRSRVRYALARYDRVVALYPRAAQVLHDEFGVARSRLCVIANGVPSDAFAQPDEAARAEARRALAIDDDAFVVVVAGALVPEKGVDVAIRAAAATGATLVIAGDGPERQRLRGWADHERADARFVGSQRDVAALYRAADVSCLPSRGGDCMPASLIEAALCGVPSVSTDVGGIGEIVVHNRTGVLVPIGDVEALAAAFADYRDDRALRLAHGAQAHEHAQRNFTIEHIAAQWHDVLVQVAPGTARHHVHGGVA